MSSTHFGFESVDEQDKARRVRGVFDSVAPKYDVMNDLMSMGLHRAWKAYTVLVANVGRATRCWTSPAAPATWRWPLPPRWAAPGVWCTPTSTRPCCAKAATGCWTPASSADAGLRRRAPAFPDASFDVVTVAFGLRNMTHKEDALREMNRVLKPGGKLLVLEFSKVAKPLEKIYDWYSFKVLPRLGKLVANDDSSYQYLAESIRMHPGQEELKALMRKGGFGHVDYHNITGGVVALHVGIKC
jgi:demethylmenaquinone methyltransferase/2-methoxy-6-polyprenyl-1,4-benzoquinol methylase